MNNKLKIILGSTAIILCGVITFTGNKIYTFANENKESYIGKSYSSDGDDEANGSSYSSYDSSRAGNSSSRKQDYIDKYMRVTGGTVDMMEDYTRTSKLGMAEVELKNNGDRDVKDVTVTVFFRDDQGKKVAQQSICVLSEYVDDPLNANYSWKMQDDKFYELTSIPRSVDRSNYTIEVTDITFAD